MNWEDTSETSSWPIRYDLRDTPPGFRHIILVCGERVAPGWHLFVGFTPRQEISEDTARSWLANPQLLVMELTL